MPKSSFSKDPATGLNFFLFAVKSPEKITQTIQQCVLLVETGEHGMVLLHLRCYTYVRLYIESKSSEENDQSPPLKNQRAEHFQRGLERVAGPWASFNFGLGRPESPLFLEGGRAGGGRDCLGRKAKLAPLCPYSKLDSARCFNWLANKKYAQKTIRTPMVFLLVDASTLPLLMHEVA